LIPLNVGQQSVGVLRLSFADGAKREKREKYNYQPDADTSFFWTVLDQAAALIERGRLRSENLRLEILQRTDTLRASLLSSVSHDLRTPLTVIKTSASSLLEEEIQWTEEEKRSIAQSIEREADRLNRLVGNLLDMSRIEDGAIQPDKDFYQLTALVQDVIDRLQPLLQDRTVQMRLPDNLPSVEVDYLQIDQVITNLIENAVRYTPATSPIEVELHTTDNQVILHVADRGPGIADDDRERIFDKFYRVLGEQRFSVKDGHAPGLGLGLAVCKGLVEAHGGTIWVESRQGGGTIFCVALPVATFEGSFA
jgi:two-component system sensor histidine kinase KdpD